MCTHVQCSIIYNIENTKSTSVSINGSMDKENVIHTHTHRILFDHKKEEKFAICNNMHRSWGHYTMWNTSNKDRYLMLWLYKESKNKQRSTWIETKWKPEREYHMRVPSNQAGRRAAHEEEGESCGFPVVFLYALIWCFIWGIEVGVHWLQPDCCSQFDFLDRKRQLITDLAVIAQRHWKQQFMLKQEGRSTGDCFLPFW